MPEAHADIADDDALFIKADSRFIAQNQVLYTEQFSDCRRSLCTQMINMVSVIAVFSREFFLSPHRLPIAAVRHFVSENGL